MKRIVFLLLGLLFFGETVAAQDRTVSQGYQIADWYLFKTSAVTYTFDDNSAKQFTVAQPLFDKYGYKVTFFVITSKITNWTNCINAGNSGHEIASHTIHHKKMSDMELTEQEKELKGSQESIRSEITSSYCQTLAYPNCALSDRNTTAKYYIAARSCAGKIVPQTPADFYRISSISTGAYSDSYVQTARQFNEKVNAARDSKGWCVFLTHCIDDEKGYSPTESVAIAGHLEYMRENENSFWIAPFVEVVKYIRERNAVSVQERTIDGDSYLMTVTDTLPDEIYNVPVTIRREMPFKWENAALSRNGVSIPHTLSTIAGKRYFTFNVIPDKGDLIVSRAVSSGINQSDKPDGNSLKLMPNPFAGQMSLMLSGRFSYSVYNLSGKVVEKGRGTDSAEIGRNLPAGTFLLQVDRRRDSYRAKIIKE